ncbi:MAG: glycoside hydrolase family 3 protein [Pelagimonas sp.]|jgi:beta-N-acetylhexosaminidase|nr:glycoside hydrolase family 3 protein [Pelagimonas sp.]
MSPFGATILGCLGPRLTAQERGFFATANPFGFILFNRNLEDTEQIRALCADLRDCVGRDAPIFIDQEGGRVQRLRPPLAREWSAPLDLCQALGPSASRAMYLRYQIIASELRGLGIDGNCAPLVDVARPDTHPVLRNRCYGEDTDTVVKIARAVADGCMRGGVLPVIKHMPGHGLGTLDSHHELPHVSAPRDILDTVDFAAFAALADQPLGMTGHLVFQAIDDRPATISPVIIDLIRSQIGFDGLLMTDDLSMKALGGSFHARARAAISAGCDVILHCNGDMNEMRPVVEAAGTLSERGQIRAQRALNLRKPAPTLDIDALEDEFQGLVSQTA